MDRLLVDEIFVVESHIVGMQSVLDAGVQWVWGMGDGGDHFDGKTVLVGRWKLERRSRLHRRRGKRRRADLFVVAQIPGQRVAQALCARVNPEPTAMAESVDSCYTGGGSTLGALTGYLSSCSTRHVGTSE